MLKKAINQILNTPRPVFEAALQSSIVPERAVDFTPTFSRTTTATVTDFEGLIKNCKSGEARFVGARRVENGSNGKSEAISTSNSWFNDIAGTGLAATTTLNYAASPIGSNTATRIQFSLNGGTASTDQSGIVSNATSFSSPSGNTSLQTIWLKSNTGSNQVIYFGYTGNPTRNPITVTTSWQRFFIARNSHTLQLGLRGGVPGDSIPNTADILAWGAQIEDGTGKANQNPSEYVSNGVLSAPYHGANVDGVKYFPYLNGNTVSSNVVTEANGVPIVSANSSYADNGGPWGYLSEGQRTNLCLRSEEFDNASWTKTDTTITANNIVAPNGLTVADLLTEGVANTGKVMQDFTITTSTNYVWSCYLKKGNHDFIRVIAHQTTTGANAARIWVNLNTGVIGSTGNEGSGITYVSSAIEALPNGWYRVSLVFSATFTNLSVGSISAGADTSTARVNNGTRYQWGAQLEQASFASSYIPTTSASVTRNADGDNYPLANFKNTVGSIYFEAKLTSWSNAAGTAIGDGSNGIKFSSSNSGAQIADGTNTVDGPSGTPSQIMRVCASWQNGRMRIAVNGVAGNDGAFDGSLNLTNLALMVGSFGTIRKVKIFNGLLSRAAMIRMTQ